MEPINQAFITSAIRHFRNYRSLAEKAIEQLQPRQLFISPAEESNSIAIIMQHMAGNLLSRFTDFLTTDGEKEWRDRDEEFETKFTDKENLMDQWNKGWDCLFDVLNSLTPEQLPATVYIRQEAHTITDALVRQLTHHASHVGQIIYISKMMREGEWKSLSIPKRKPQSHEGSK